MVEPLDPAQIICGVALDSRKITPGDLFVALPGERVDGHAFIADVLRQGAAAVLVTDPVDEKTCLLAKEMGAAIIEVSNTSAAFVDLAYAWRKKLSAKIVGITGSSGKTTTKNLVRDVLAAQFRVVATQGNQNNELGVPKTILEADPETEIIVVEMGMRGLGQIAQLCDLVAPHMGLITNIGDAHLELLGSKEKIAQAKAELFEALPKGEGVAFINRSDAFADLACNFANLEERNVQLVYFDGSGAPVAETEAAMLEENKNSLVKWGAWATDISLDASGCPCFTLHLPEAQSPCTLPLRGLHNVHNATAAASVGAAFGMEIDKIVAALKNVVAECGRQQVREARGGFTIVDDSYNANPDSMRAALTMFSAMEFGGRRVAVLGDMGELGQTAQACHEGIGQLAASLSLDLLICIGDLSAHISRIAVESGMDEIKVIHVSNVSDVLEELDTYLLPGDGVLVKASRFMGLERVVGGLVS